MYPQILSARYCQSNRYLWGGLMPHKKRQQKKPCQSQFHTWMFYSILDYLDIGQASIALKPPARFKDDLDIQTHKILVSRFRNSLRRNNIRELLPKFFPAVGIPIINIRSSYLYNRNPIPGLALMIRRFGIKLSYSILVWKQKLRTYSVDQVDMHSFFVFVCMLVFVMQIMSLFSVNVTYTLYCSVLLHCHFDRSIGYSSC